MTRIVSLSPGGTEILASLGFEGQLVGRSHECDYPPSVAQLPVCSAPGFDSTGSSYQINARVKEHVRKGLSPCQVHADKLRTLQPDVIIAQAPGNGAVTVNDVEQAVRQRHNDKPLVVALQTRSLDDVWTDVYQVAEVLNALVRGQQLVDQLRSRVATIAQRAAQASSRPTVAALDWIDPLHVAGNWMPELIHLAGGTNLLGNPGQPSTPVTWDDLLDTDPDVIVAFPHGFTIERARGEMHAQTWAPHWHSLKAVRGRRVYLLDGNRYFNRPGPRLVESLEIFAEILHPHTFEFDHQGTGWEPF